MSLLLGTPFKTLILENLMKNLTLLTALIFTIMISTQAFAVKGGQPGAHDVSGKDFGSTVSDTAKSGPGNVGDHASGGKRNGK